MERPKRPALLNAGLEAAFTSTGALDEPAAAAAAAEEEEEPPVVGVPLPDVLPAEPVLLLVLLPVLPVLPLVEPVLLLLPLLLLDPSLVLFMARALKEERVLLLPLALQKSQ